MTLDVTRSESTQVLSVRNVSNASSLCIFIDKVKDASSSYYEVTYCCIGGELFLHKLK